MTDPPEDAAESSRRVEESYDRVAEEYTRRVSSELSQKPFDRDILGRFASRTRTQGAVCDVGCGPGHVTAYLQSLGVDVRGVDVSAAMVSIAAKVHSNIP